MELDKVESTKDPETVRQIDDLAKQIGESLNGKTQQVALEALAIAMLNTLLGCGYSLERGEAFFASLMQNWIKYHPESLGKDDQKP